MSNNYNPLSRRHFLRYGLGLGAACSLSSPALAVTDSAPRIAALDWTAVELIDALGLAPVAVCDIANYRQWVVTPSLPAEAIELGLRNEPNLEVLAALRPDMMIVLQYSTLPDAQLAQFAEVLRYPFTLPGQTILTVAHNNLQALAQHLHRESYAQQAIARWELDMAESRQRLSHWHGKRLLLYSFLSPRQVLVMSPSSLFGEVLSMLNLECAWQGSANAWGSSVIGVEQLFPVQTDIAIEFQHGERGATRSGLWEKMPFMQQGNHYQASGAWMYGGLQAARRFTYQLVHLSGLEHD
ncbi:ABC transporter substrate-binding protein [Rosenbergiella collisarenosi]|uniref:ABC transporter substrate-binding protein n=1 Tax=Rosenbergiella collisarenosi TaxID=1544695 RepID=UPI001F4FE90A|nr:ABC transporter substrate-binding protein [Rosenbergiella collisarenosi]